MKIKTNRVAQVAIEVLVIMGILVIGSIILGIMYFNSHQENLKISGESAKVIDESLQNLKYVEELNPENPAVCGNGICEIDENTSNCSNDCPALDGSLPAAESKSTSIKGIRTP